MRGQRGHTIIEVMAAMAMMTIGLLGTLPLFWHSAEGAVTASKLTQAVTVAQSKLDELLVAPYGSVQLAAGTYNDQMNLGPGGTAYKPGGAATGAYNSQDGWFARQWTIAEVVQAGLNSYKTITVTVRWYDAPIKRMRTVAVFGSRAQPR
jgi:type II secretory pathway pseudopilin PulG